MSFGAGSHEAPRATYVGIDPGRSKCGLAVVYADGARKALEVVVAEQLADRLEAEVRSGRVHSFCVGHATGSDIILTLCASRWPAIPRYVIDETNTTLEARRLYYVDHPPRGLARLLPRGLLVPNEPLDGYAALLIIQRWLASASATGTPAR